MAFKLDSEKLLTKRNLIITGVVVALLIILIIVGTVTGNKKSPMEGVFRLNARVTNLSKTINTYGSALKSSDLRTMSSSLSTTVSALSSSLKTLSSSEEYKALEKETTTALAAEETELNNELNTNLENAKLNATLDRTYANEMARQIYLLQQLENDCLAEAEDEGFKAALESSISNLNALYPQFQSFK